MIVERITFTGADESVFPDDLLQISNDHPIVEWGILHSTNKMGMEPRYPSRNWIDILFLSKKAEDSQAKLSHHICGKFAQKFVEGKYDFRWNFDRMQINRRIKLTDKEFEKFKNICQKANDKGTEIIFQLSGTQDDIDIFQKSFQEGIRCSALFDKSGGRGKGPSKWSGPIDHYPCGYAGGLGPENLEEELKKIEEKVEDRRIWIDMETKIRSENNKAFNLVKVKKCIEIVEKFNDKR